MERKDYYQILGVNKDSSSEDIKKAYRKLSLQYHPDRQNGKSDAEKKKAEDTFKEIAEAYSVLSDPNKKAEYDNPMSSFNFDGFGSNDPFDLFSSFFGGGMNFQFNQETRVQRGQSIRINISVSLEDILSGVQKTIKYKRLDICPNCHGSGKTSQTKEEKCPHCGGKGVIAQQQGNMRMVTTCPHCGGKGSWLVNPCSDCDGTGLKVKENEITIDIAKGFPQGAQLSVPNQGNASSQGNKGGYGDLYVVINDKPHEVFKREDANLIMTLEIPIVDAILGCTREVETLNKTKLRVKINQGTTDGTILQFANYGLPIYGSKSYGSMLVVIKHKMPLALSTEEKNLLTQLKESENFK